MNRFFLKYLTEKLNKNIIKTHKENPQVEYQVLLEEIEEIDGYFKSLFSVKRSSMKGRIIDILKINELLSIQFGEFKYVGSLSEVIENQLCIICYEELLPLSTYTISRLVNCNNYALLRAIKRVKLTTNVSEFISQSFTKCLVNKLECIIEYLTLDKLSDSMILFYYKTCTHLRNEDKRTLDDSLFVGLKEERIKCLNKSIQDGDFQRFNDTEFLEMIDKVHDMYDKVDQKVSVVDIESKLSSLSIKPDSHLVLFNKCLNDSQIMAVNEVINYKSYKIIGPPGTGKTSTIIEIISQLLKRNKKVLVCAPSNIAIDNLIEKFMISKWYTAFKTSFYRRGSAFKGLKCHNLEKIAIEMTKHITPIKGELDFPTRLKKIRGRIMVKIQKHTDLVFATTFSSRKELYHFDFVIIDEACQASAIECFLALTHGQNIILVGDKNQLCHESRSLYELLEMKTFLLDIQYRMCERLIGFSNISFYDNKIKSFIKDSIPLIKGSPMVFLDTKNDGFNEIVIKKSIANLGEVELVAEVSKYIESSDIGIISPYVAQVGLLKKKLPTLEVASIDGFQGREKEYIILSLVRSNSEGNFGFLDNFKRLNVAITRCKKGLIVIGNSNNFKECEIINQYFEYSTKHFISIDSSQITSTFGN